MRDGQASDVRRQIGLTITLQVFASAVLGGALLATNHLVNDRLADFYLFRDTLHSLNVFGEFPWWNPSMWAGFPFYYVNFLYWPGREPLFGTVMLTAWLLGRMQITIASYQALYVAYFAFLVPLMLSLSVLALARQILRRRLAIYLVIVLTAFSPGVVLSLADLGSRATAYGFFFAAALLHFLRNPGRSSFFLLGLIAIALASTFTYFTLFWNIFFVPAFIVLTCVGLGGLTRRARRAFQRVPRLWWAALAAAVLLCLLPTVLTYTHGTDILSDRAEGARYYSFIELRPGNPLEALAISTPGVGFEWTDYESPSGAFVPWPVFRAGQFSSFGYMGMLTLPLVCLGLVFGRPYWSIRLYVGIAAVMTIIMLSAFSPFFSLILGWPSPFRGINHYSDLVHRLGLFAVFLLAAGLGVESLLKQAPTRRWILAGLFVVISVASVIWLVSLHDFATHRYLFGLGLALIFLYAVGLARFALATRPAQINAALVVLLVLMFVDTSTLAFAHLRVSLTHADAPPVEPGPDTIGSVIGRVETEFLYLRGMNDPALLIAPAQPVTLTTAETGEPLPQQDAAILHRTYNGITVRVNASQPARLEWRDAYFPFWRAWVNGAEVLIERTPRNMKAVLVPAGASDLVFRFSPTVLRATVASSYLTMAAAFILWLRERRIRSPRP